MLRQKHSFLAPRARFHPSHRSSIRYKLCCIRARNRNNLTEGHVRSSPRFISIVCAALLSQGCLTNDVDSTDKGFWPAGSNPQDMPAGADMSSAVDALDMPTPADMSASTDMRTDLDMRVEQDMRAAEDMNSTACPEGSDDLDGDGDCDPACGPDTCNGRGTCGIVGDEPWCECDDFNYTGQFCEQCSDAAQEVDGECVELASSCEPNPCYSGGACMLISDPNTAVIDIAVCTGCREGYADYTQDLYGLCQNCADGFVKRDGACVLDLDGSIDKLAVTSNVPAARIQQSAHTLWQGGNHACAILTNGVIECWGANDYGQLGKPSSENELVGVRVPLDSTDIPISITTGVFHTCALLDTGKIKCWGRNNQGQLGTGDFTSSDQPRAVALDAADIAIAVRAASVSTCALLSSGEVKCWGQGDGGQLGSSSLPPNNKSQHPIKADLPAGAHAVTLELGTGSACVKTLADDVYCWGANSDGAVGDQTTALRATPTRSNLSGASTCDTIHAGSAHTCALLDTGKIECWGANTSGQLGTGEVSARELTPRTVALDASEHVASMRAGSHHNCALLDTGKVKCWGLNMNGQVGVGNTTDTPSPSIIALAPGKRVARLAASSLVSCALYTDGTAACWGYGVEGALGHGLTRDETSPVDVTATSAPIAIP